jgi:hypothetical protein
MPGAGRLPTASVGESICRFLIVERQKTDAAVEDAPTTLISDSRDRGGILDVYELRHRDEIDHAGNGHRKQPGGRELPAWIQTTHNFILWIARGQRALGEKPGAHRALLTMAQGEQLATKSWSPPDTGRLRKPVELCAKWRRAPRVPRYRKRTRWLIGHGGDGEVSRKLKGSWYQ